MGELAVIIVIFVCGLVAMFIELFIPGAVLGMIGFLAVVGSIVYAIVGGYTLTAVILILCALAFVPVFFMMWKGVIGRLFAIQGGEAGFRASQTITEDLVGVEGETLTPLHPTGIARLNEKRYDVVTRGEMLDRGTRVKVIEVSGNRIVVKRCE
jgi:membrane-bound serine protease (ClpP class)